MTKQTVYLPVKVEDTNGNYIPDKSVLIVKEQEEMDKFWEALVKQQQGYFFTPEELNAYTQSVIKQALETAAEKANSFIDGDESVYIQGNVWSEVDKQSITNTFEETYKKFEV